MSNFNQEQYLKLIQEASKKISALQSITDRLREPIAIIGMGCRFPKASTLNEYWKLLSEGGDGIQDRPEFHSYIDPFYDEDLTKYNTIYTKQGGFLEQDPALFDARFFNISGMEAASLDPQHRLFLEVTWEALEHAGIAPSSLSGTNTGVFAGICSNDYAWKLVKQQTQNIDVYLGSGNAYSPISGRVSYLLDIHGPSLAIDTACSSSLTSTHVAVNSIRMGECDVAIVGGIQRYLSPEYWMNLCKSRILSPTGQCRSFSEDANGYVRGEGCGVIILKRLSQAKIDKDTIYAVIAGTSTRQDGKTSSLTVPNGASQQEAIKRALDNAGLSIDDIDYIEAHGTGTPIGDPIEMNAIGTLFKKRKNPLLVGTVKSNIGHLEGSAGIAGLIKVVLALRHKQIPKNLHFTSPSTRIAWDDMPVKIVTELTDWKATPDRKRTAGVSSFGFEGVNTHVVLQEQGIDEELSFPFPIDINAFAITLSAKTPAALDAMIAHYINYIKANPSVDIRDIAFTTNCGRDHYIHKLAIVCSSIPELLTQLENVATKKYASTSHRSLDVVKDAPRMPKGVAFMFTGQGSQYINMGRDLYLNQPIFKETMDLCNKLILDKNLLDTSLLDIIYSEDTSKLQMTMYTQPALFMIEYALVKMLAGFGVEPSVVIGHSVGEYVAACVAGIFSLEDALTLITSRGKLMQRLPQNGEMVALNVSEKEALTALNDEKRVSIAAINGPNSLVLSGDKMVLKDIIARLAQNKEIHAISLHVSHAFHSHLMAPMLAEFREIAEKINYKTPIIPFISNITGRAEIMKPMNADYWCEHILSPVRFYEGIKALDGYGHALLEIGPDATLLSMSKSYIADTYKVTLPIMQNNKGDWLCLMRALAQLYTNSVNIHWKNLYHTHKRHPISLPTYPWQREKYWVD